MVMIRRGGFDPEPHGGARLVLLRLLGAVFQEVPSIGIGDSGYMCEAVSDFSRRSRVWDISTPYRRKKGG